MTLEQHMKDIADIFGILGVGVIAFLLRRPLIHFCMIIMSYLFLKAAKDIENKWIREPLQIASIIIFVMTTLSVLAVYLIP